MKKLALLIGLLATAPTFASMSGTPDSLNSLGLDEIVNPSSMQVAWSTRSVNPYWGAGTGFHTVYPKYGSPYQRSNPDGYCWNNKYGC